jgi:2-iminoacetate synthase ThiH
VEQTLIELKEAGLDSLTGSGAEFFCHGRPSANRKAGRTPVQRNTFNEPIKVLAETSQLANETEPPTGKSRVLEDNLATA